MIAICTVEIIADIAVQYSAKSLSFSRRLSFFCSFPFHSFFLLSDFFRLQCGVAKISHKIYSVKQFLKKIILTSVYAGAFLFHKVVEE